MYDGINMPIRISIALWRLKVISRYKKRQLQRVEYKSFAFIFCSTRGLSGQLYVLHSIHFKCFNTVRNKISSYSTQRITKFSFAARHNVEPLRCFYVNSLCNIQQMIWPAAQNYCKRVFICLSSKLKTNQRTL